MPRSLRVYRGVQYAPARLSGVLDLPRGHRQAEVIVAMSSFAAASRASEAAGFGKFHRDFAGQTWNDEANRVARARPGIVFARGLDDRGPWTPILSCPDGGTCHHRCVERCWRVLTCEPLSAAGWGSEWPEEIRRLHAPEML